VTARRWLVVGAGGMLGADVVALLSERGERVTGAARADLDVLDPAACRSAAVGHDVVVNCAAYTAVDDAETHEAEAFAVNATGAANLGRAATSAGARLVHVSTDYVFGGTATVPYAENAPLAPRSAYGRTKAAGEWAARAEAADALVVRTAWLYGANGANFVATMARLAGERETVGVVDDQAGQPTWTRDVADAIHRLVAAEAPGGPWHATSAGETTWCGLARAVFSLLGLDPSRVQAIPTSAYPRPAPRPAYSVLGDHRWAAERMAPLRPWTDALAAAWPSLGLGG
jgi:dTDP-4-dehydrorhamnose reductase